MVQGISWPDDMRELYIVSRRLVLSWLIRSIREKSCYSLLLSGRVLVIKRLARIIVILVGHMMNFFLPRSDCTMVMHVRLMLFLVILSSGLLLPSPSLSRSLSVREHPHGERTWKTVNELSTDEKARIDLSENTPRNSEFPYLPAESYPFQPPFTAEEMGYRMMEFTQRPRWSCAFANLFGSITAEGFLLGKGMNISYSAYPDPGGVGVELATKPGAEIYRYLTQGVFPPESQGSQNLLIRYRTDHTFTKKEDLFSYSLATRRVRHQNQMRRGDKFPYMAQSFDDASGRDAWEFHWRILGTDILHHTVRFPVTRPTVTVADGDYLHDVPTTDIKLMGDEYPHYTAGGGVSCYVVEARPREDWLPDYYASRIIYWLDQYAFYPLRTEVYDREGRLSQIEVRLTKLMNPALKERGYGPFLILGWDVPLDLMTYIVRDGHRTMKWSAVDRETFFNPDFMRRQWFLTPIKSQLGVDTPEEFFLRPMLDADKFPTERHIQLNAALAARIQAQNATGHLVFDSGQVRDQQQALLQR